MFGKRRTREPELLPGGYRPGDFPPGTAYASSPVPTHIHEQDQVAKGRCLFTGQVLMSGGPQQSPLLWFKMTREAIWTLNTDGSLYNEVPWSTVKSCSVDYTPQTGGLKLHGLFVNAEFMLLKFEPAGDTAQAAFDLIKEKGIETSIIDPDA